MFNLRELFKKPDNWGQIYKQTSSAFHTSNDVSKTCREEKVINVIMAVSLIFNKIEKQPSKVFYIKKLFFKNLRNIHRANRKTRVLEPLFNSEYCETFRSTYFEEHLLLKICSKWEKFKIIHKEFHFSLKKRFFQHQYQKRVKMFVFISSLVSYKVCIHMQYLFGVVRNKL